MNRDEHLSDEPRGVGAPGDTGGDSLDNSEHLPALRMPLWLAGNLRRVYVPSRELEDAQRRVEVRVFSNIPHGVSRLAHRRRRRRIGLALMLGMIITTVFVSMLSASALPSSPLYTVKRGEEWIAYQTAWSEERRGDVLLLAANRRLEESKSLAHLQEDTAVNLALDLRGNLMDLISLYQTLNITRPASDVARKIKDGLASMLNEQIDAAQSSEQSGQLWLASTFRENARLARDALTSRHLQLP